LANYQPKGDPYDFNKGFSVNANSGQIDALRGTVRLAGNQSASIDALAAAAARGDSRRRG
jgi:hypothetical protein